MKSKDPLCCISIDITFHDLIFPNRMSDRGKEFMRARDLGKMNFGELINGAIELDNGLIHLNHRCPKLTPNGECSIYENRPQVCKEWICNKEEQCDFCSKYKTKPVAISAAMSPAVTNTPTVPTVHKVNIGHNLKELTLVIPSRKEMFLAKTIEDALSNIEADTEIIATLDGATADPIVPQHDKVNLIHVNTALGQRGATNIAVKLSKSKYVMKVDAHCSFDKGFDRKMLEMFKITGDNVTMVPIMRNLWAFDWKCYHCGWKKYQGPTPTKCEACGKTDRVRRKMIWKGKHNPQSTSYCFDAEPHFQYFEDWKHRPQYVKDKAEKKLTETMSLQGSCFMCTRENYWDKELCDEKLGNWGNQGIEVAAKTWLSGGTVYCNHDTWYAHMFRTQGGDFSFPWEVSGRDTQRTKNNVKNLLWSGKWHKQVPGRSIKWLVQRFMPVPGWKEEDIQKLLG